MSDEERSLTQVILTDRALDDIRGIEHYSVEKWGRSVADRYLDEIDAALDRLRRQPSLLRNEPQFAEHLQFYRVGKHLLVCDLIESQILVLTVIHASMDLPRRIGDFEPQLATEAELLHARLKRRNLDN